MIEIDKTYFHDFIRHLNIKISDMAGFFSIKPIAQSEKVFRIVYHQHSVDEE